MNPTSTFGRERMTQPVSFVSPVGQQFHGSFSSSNPRLDRSDSRSFTDFQDGILPQDQIVLDSASGKILLSPSRGDQEPDPISRFYNAETPWHPRSLESVGDWPPSFITHNKQSVVRPHAPYPSYREPIRSNPDSHVTGRHQPDSSYVTNGPGSKSVVSGGEAMEPGDDNQSFIEGIGTMDLQTSASNASFYSGNTQTAPSIAAGYIWPEQEAEDHQPLACTYPDCKDEPRFKNASELRKHQQRHEKPHKCTVSGCTRTEGFTTKNDLDRHKKSLHGISLPNGRSFRCAGMQCNKRGKIWPRLDNFKSHCNRMHSKEDIDELIKRSEIESERLAALQSASNSTARTTSERPLASTEFQDANLLLDLSQGAHQPSGPQPPDMRNLGMNRIVNTVTITPLPKDRDSNARMQPNPAETDFLPRPESVPSSSYRSNALQPANSQVNHRQLGSPLPGPGLFGYSPANAESAKRLHSPLARPQAAFLQLLVTQADLEGWSKQLAADLAHEFRVDDNAEDRIQKLISRRMAQLASSLSPGRSAIDGCGTNDNSNNNDNEEPRARPKRVRCRICSKTMDRPCDLKKHEKRHSRPWGCTNATCSKTFGSKNDWKRHENSQHYQLETWRCHEAVATSKIGTCAKIFFRRDPFQSHLRKEHGRNDEEYIREQCRKRRIGRNWQNGFWCGFCKAIVKLSTKGLEAWDERFNHIDDEHFKKGQNIDDWYPMDKDVPKGKLKDLQSQRRRRGGDGGGGGGAEDDFVRGSTGDADGDRDGEEESEPELDGTGESEVEDYPAERTKRRRSCNDHGGRELEIEADEGSGQREVTLKVPVSRPVDWYCDDCHYGPMQDSRDTGCVSCGRRRIE